MISTVLGEIEAAELGVASMHEHVLADASALQRTGVELLDPAQPVTAELAGALRWGQLALEDNLRLEDVAVAAEELAHAARGGQRAVVEATSLGLGPDHGRLPGISRATGLHVVACYGAYLGGGIPAWYRELDENGRERLFAAALADAIPGTDFRAGMLGIMGTTDAFTGVAGVDERASLRAAARAAAAHGAAVSIRLDPGRRNGLAVLAAVEAAGLPAARVVLANVDEYADPGYLAELGAAGAVLEMCFGGEGGHLGRVRNTPDFARLDALVGLLADAPEIRWVLGTSLWTKAQYRRFGGPGYDHLVARVIPGLRSLGVDAETLARLTVTEPARVLDRGRASAPSARPQETHP
ncbi:hypothetical protein [Agromyces sp. Soil535]|uniref:phosphotriesterase family protein n=1 Tax=Agromyces sp. Soil535 TaxID=1736390 RepID=UPI0006FFD866|nr:hypothetical protein [Agromyces sp. Soil535]KRE22989.1 hypothetical protein ASG80_08975 [Agromyces sp. Soil535]